MALFFLKKMRLLVDFLGGKKSESGKLNKNLDEGLLKTLEGNFKALKKEGLNKKRGESN